MRREVRERHQQKTAMVFHTLMSSTQESNERLYTLNCLEIVKRQLYDLCKNINMPANFLCMKINIVYVVILIQLY